MELTFNTLTSAIKDYYEGKKPDFFSSYKGLIWYKWDDVSGNWVLSDRQSKVIGQVNTYNGNTYRIDQAIEHFKHDAFYGKPEYRILCP